MTDISKEAVDALLQGVTVGPWMVAGVRGKVEGQSVHNVFRYNAGEKRDEQICAVWYDTKTGLGAKDARFIAAARELVPAQAAEITALRAERDRYLRHLTAGAENCRRFEARAERLDVELQEQHRVRKAWAARAVKAEAERDAANALLDRAVNGPWRDGDLELARTHLGAKP